jgi:hypothetical protein
VAGSCLCGGVASFAASAEPWDALPDDGLPRHTVAQPGE